MTYQQIEIRLRTIAIGADVAGVALDQINDATLVEIKRALHEHLVLFFHDQRLTPAAHMAFAGRLGRMEIHEVFTPTPQELEWARRVLSVFEESGGAATRTADGEFIDMPVALRARRILGA